MTIAIKGEGKTVNYFLYDEYDTATHTSSMSRTTGYTATAVLNMMMNSLFTAKGVFPPELVGNNESCFNFILKYLRERNVIYTKTEISD